MDESLIYRVYCSKCNMEKKAKMSWKRYLKYITFDRKTQGYHEIDASYVREEPSKCPFGHTIDQKRTKIISKE